MHPNILYKSIRLLLAPDDGGGDGGGEEKVTAKDVVIPEGDKSKAFFSKFSAKRNAPPGVGGDVNSEVNQEAAQTLTDNANREQEHRDQQSKEAKEIGDRAKENRPKPFVKQQIDRAKNAEQERDEFKGKATQLETSLAEKDKAMAELQAKIDSGDYSTKKEQEFQSKIQEIESKAAAEREALVNENRNLQSKLSYYNLSEDPDFRESYVMPVERAYGDAIEIIGNDESMVELMERGLIANAAALNARNQNDRIRAERERDTIFSGIVEGMSTFTANRFTSAINDYISGAHRHAKALADHGSTVKEIKEKTIHARNKAYSEHLNVWKNTYTALGDKYKDSMEMTPEEIKEAKRLGYDVEAESRRIDAIADKTVIGESAMEEAIDLIHRGRAMPRMQARVKLLKAEIADKDALIAKLRAGGGASLGSGSTGGGGGGGEQKPSREEFHKKFSASRINR